FSTSWPVWAARIWSTRARWRRISRAWMSMSADWPWAPPWGGGGRTVGGGGGVGGGVALAWRARGQDDRRRRGRPAEAGGGHVAADVAHGVVDAEQGRDRPAGRGDVGRDGLFRVLGLQVDE